MTTITTYTDVCLRILKTVPEVPQHLSEILEKASQQSQRAGGIIHRLRRLVRKAQTEVAPFDINDAFNEVIASVSANPNHGVIFQMSFSIND